MPSVRELARDIGLSPNTVAAAYGELRRRGITSGIGRAGTHIRGRPPISSRIAVAIAPGLRDLQSGQPDPSLLPDWPRVRASRRAYGEPAMSARLRQVAEERLATEGIDVGHLAVVGGALDGVERVLQAWLRVGDRVVVEDPGYSAALDLLAAMSFDVVPVPLDAHGARPGELRAALDRGANAVLLTPRAQNPTGAAWDAQRASELASVLGDHPEVLLIEDDHAGPVAGAPLHTVAGTTAHWATIRSVSKWLAPDLRLALLAGDEATVGRVQGRQALGTGWVSYLLQDTAAKLWADPRTVVLLEKATTVYQERREVLAGRLREHGLTVAGNSGLTTWIPVADEAGAVRALAASGWAVIAGERFRIASPPAIRVRHATLDSRGSAAFVEDLASALRRPAIRMD
jgi:DNA-binding transcriptional MocR family regulator